MNKYAAYRIERTPTTYVLLYNGSRIGFASIKHDCLWWWTAQLPGRKGARKGREDLADCIAAGGRIPKTVVRRLLEEAA